jgi:hypothetical protein
MATTAPSGAWRQARPAAATPARGSYARACWRCPRPPPWGIRAWRASRRSRNPPAVSTEDFSATGAALAASAVPVSIAITFRRVAVIARQGPSGRTLGAATNKWRVWRLLGPGLITRASDDVPVSATVHWHENTDRPRRSTFVPADWLQRLHKFLVPALRERKVVGRLAYCMRKNGN